MATRRICEFLDGNGAEYAMFNHHIAYTAQEAAQSTHIPGQYMAKIVIVWIDNRLAMAVVPATKDVDLESLRRAQHAGHVRLADEADFADRFVGCQLGTVPPFGNLFGIETFYDPSLSRHEHIAFPAGTHTDVIVMTFADYYRLARPLPICMAIEAIKAGPCIRL